ncbi:hypothetical protein P170DRAFT_450302 [Aspergillus steynii IBT 23096]|uniref:Uncharacterized protein n=1 Tax=Aspergillus steynii IBT 23096 TaxID=1392250 RepID=A0A2I2FTW4_9EURO|nr:uncharacterized protein P170DRAFT_450302 [Aspergillus steynii IBT 23096]PLB44088.1 hypothetical protein P170DRAFT_450302 [Aspergillus steynii IBT 23096]
MIGPNAQTPAVHYGSLFIFFGYLSLAIFLVFICFRPIYLRYQARQHQNDWAPPYRHRHLALFVFLAGLSLGTTWYHMIRLFAHSYNSWAASPDGLPYWGGETSLITRLGLWLHKTYVFQEAWETVSENPSRFWWSGQIFGWTIGWSLFLGITGRRYHIPHVWVFMLVAQGVSVSFAANLFFAAIIVSSQPNEKDVSLVWHPQLLYELGPVALSILYTVAVPTFAYKQGFMPILLVPHLLVFIPCVLGPRGSSVPAKPDKAQFNYTTQRYVKFLQYVAAVSVALQGYLTILMLQHMGTDVPHNNVARYLLDTMYVHPACSSVSWDVIMCTLSAFVWMIVHKFDMSQMLGGQ